MEHSQKEEGVSRSAIDGLLLTTSPTSNARRFYECMFCKRGFTNAQALGGHMNIHRKERNREEAKSVVSSHQMGNRPINPNLQHSFLEFDRCCLVESYGCNFLASSTFRLDDSSTNLSLQVGSSNLEHRSYTVEMSTDENEIDLELRLGNGHL